MGSGAKNFQSFEILTAANLNNYLMSQSVISLPGTASIGTAGTAIGTATTATLAPAEGMLVYLQDLNQYQMNLDGSASGWYPIAGQMPYLELGKSATQSITSGSETKVTWPNTVINRGDFSIASDVVTLPLAGVYRINAAVYYPGNSTGYRLTRIYVNGTLLGNDMVAPSASGDATVRSTMTMKLAANSTIEIRTLQNSGSSLALQVNGTRLTIEYVGP